MLRFLKKAKVQTPIVNRDIGNVSIRVDAYTFKSGRVMLGFSSITQILRVGGLTKITPSVVRSILIDMINKVSGPKAPHENKGYSVGEMASMVYYDTNIAVWTQPTGRLSSLAKRWPIHKPSNDTGIWLIGQNCFNEVRIWKAAHGRDICLTPI